MNEEEHEAYGAMVHRGLVEKRTRNYHREQKEALDLAIGYLKIIEKESEKTGGLIWRTAKFALEEIEQTLNGEI